MQPRRRRRKIWTVLLIALALVAAACGNDSDDSTETAATPAGTDTPTETPTAPTETATPTESATDEPSATETPAPVERPSLSVTAIRYADSVFTLTNHGTTEVDANGLWICQFPDCHELSGLDPIPAGESLEIDASAINAFNPDDGEFGSYLNDEFENPQAIVSCVEWGEPGHARSSVAIEAEIWTDQAAPGGGVALVSNSDQPVSAVDWAVFSPAAPPPPPPPPDGYP